MPTLLIDGYNLIPAIPSLGRLIRRDLEQARDALLDLLHAYRANAPSRPSIIVVFDGKAHIENPHPSRKAGIQVRFSSGETADDLILRLLGGEHRGAILVTSDRALRDAARADAGELIRSGEFSGMLLARLDPEDGGREDGETTPVLTTRKKGNPKRRPKRDRRRAGKLRGL